MCAINPRFKKRIIFDFYTSHDMTEEQFINHCLHYCLQSEQTINKYGNIRVHVKETEDEAE